MQTSPFDLLPCRSNLLDKGSEWGFLRWSSVSAWTAGRYKVFRKTMESTDSEWLRARLQNRQHVRLILHNRLISFSQFFSFAMVPMVSHLLSDVPMVTICPFNYYRTAFSVSALGWSNCPRREEGALRSLSPSTQMWLDYLAIISGFVQRYMDLLESHLNFHDTTKPALESSLSARGRASQGMIEYIQKVVSPGIFYCRKTFF